MFGYPDRFDAVFFCQVGERVQHAPIGVRPRVRRANPDLHACPRDCDPPSRSAARSSSWYSVMSAIPPRLCQHSFEVGEVERHLGGNDDLLRTGCYELLDLVNLCWPVEEDTAFDG